MSELKTLKDLDIGLISERVIINNIRQEAIKDIKAILSFEKTYSDYIFEKITDKELKYSQEGKMAIVNYIKWKFNITEEELKQ